MKNLKIVSISNDIITFDNGMKLYSNHDQDCCEHHYLVMQDLDIEDLKNLEFDLSGDTFFERIESYGIALLPLNGFPVRIAGYGSNNGYYSSNLELVLTKKDGSGVFKEFDITECQEIDH